MKDDASRNDHSIQQQSKVVQMVKEIKPFFSFVEIDRFIDETK